VAIREHRRRSSPERDTVAVAAATPRSPRLGPVVFFTGVASLATEMAAARLVAPYFGSSNAVWANVIGLMLAFLALGYWLGGKVADRRPHPRLLGAILLLAAALLAVVPFAAHPLLQLAVNGFASISVVVVVGSFVSVLALFALPVTLLGAVAPFAVRLNLSSVDAAGQTAGRLYSLSTVGSILGTFLAALVAIPLVGTQRTLLAIAALVAFAALPLLGVRSLAAGALLAATLAVPPGHIKPGADVIYETESPYEYVSVVAYSDGERALQINEGVADQSVWYPRSVLTGGYWDLFLLVPKLLDRPARSMLIIGDGGGTIPRAYGRFYAGVPIDGVELDPAVTTAGRRFLGLGGNPQLRTINADGRVYLAKTSKRYDLIAVDAYRQPYVPFQLTTREFFQLVRSHLSRDGIVALNVAATPYDRQLTRAIGSTLASVLPQVWRISALRFNDLVIALQRPLTRAQLIHRLRAVAPSLQSMLPRVVHGLAPLVASGAPWTDDHAPVEWVTDRMLADQIVHRQGLDENLLPTAP
jgi:spermidine synthase